MKKRAIPNLPPLPWTFVISSTEGEPLDGRGHVYLIDANGRKIGCLWGKGPEKIASANFICDAADVAMVQEQA